MIKIIILFMLTLTATFGCHSLVSGSILNAPILDVNGCRWSQNAQSIAVDMRAISFRASVSVIAILAENPRMR